MKVRSKFAVLVALAICANATAQSPVVTISLGPDQIGRIKTAQGITTRISFPELVKEIICGDLYDPATGKGSFVVQRGDTDVFLKPVVPRGMSNLFVKVGEGGQQVYSFDLEIVSPSQALRVVNVQPAHDYASRPKQDPDASKAALASAQKQAAEIIRSARQQADRLLAQAKEEAEQIKGQAQERAAEIERQALESANEQIAQRFIQAMMGGLHERRINNTRIEVKNISITLDPKILTFNGRSYLRYAITNNDKREFTFSTIVLEAGPEKKLKPVLIEIAQSHGENRLRPGETLTGVIAFESKAIKEKDKISLSFRDAKNAEIARMNLQ
jgi:vacuolar-type H+-ATPase subunit H